MLSESHFWSSYCTFSKYVKKSKSQMSEKDLMYVECTERYVRMAETFCHKVGM
jgi:hypothetical protein